jgi:predicted O-linked N-acetylglucosamine transferase (SPINDLY family)
MASISQALAIAIEHHRAGRLDIAAQLYRQILAVEPNQAEVVHFLGVIAYQTGHHALAVEYIQRSIDLKGSVAVFHNNLGEAYRALCRIPEAVGCYRRALELNPHYAEAYSNLGAALQDQGNRDEAVACYRRAIALKPENAKAHNNLGAALQDQGKRDEAVACCRRALELEPDYAEAYSNLGVALRSQGNLDEAEACCRRALELKPGYAEAHNNLGVTLKDQEKLDEAISCYRRALERKPDYAEAHSNLGAALQEQGKLDEAVACCLRALELKPDFAEACNNLGAAYKGQGRLDRAVACYRRALALRPDFAQAHSNLVCTQIFSSDCDAQAFYEEHRRWNQHYAARFSGFAQPHLNDRSPDRRLRVGYVSPDFRNHPVALFLLPLLESHDHGSFEIFCYASVRVGDSMTDRCRAQADAWRDVLDLTDEQVAQAIRRDGIDILVDLAMHMGNNRLLVFARKPAPVQVTYLAYCGTTGLSAIDYRLTDPYLDPPGENEEFYSEQSVRLPETYWCYRPVIETPPVNTLPALAEGRVSFGCLNNFCKVSLKTLAAWSRLLEAVPRSRLLLHAYAGSHRDRGRAFFAERGIVAERVVFVDLLPLPEYFRVYQSIDMALDPFPYGGGTTTCDALWMGVPVVTLAGQTAVGRGGLSILSNLGLPELVSYDPDQYVRIAAELAQDLPRLSALRATLRDRMQASPLMDAPRFARNVEAAYRAMWNRWRANQASPAS